MRSTSSIMPGTNTSWPSQMASISTCQTGKCNWGIATQRQELTERLDPQEGCRRLVNLMTAWKHEIKEMLGGMGINSIEALRGNRLMLRGIGLNQKELEILGVYHAGE